MAVFETVRVFQASPSDLAPVAEMLAAHFRARGFEVSAERKITGDWFVSITKGGLLKSVLGLRSALNVDIARESPGIVRARAAIGIFGQQVLPSLVAYFVFWPVLIPQLWGVIRQSKLDDEAVEVVAKALETPAAPQATPGAALAANGTRAAVAAPSGARFCSACGTALTGGARFCSNCGGAVGLSA